MIDVQAEGGPTVSSRRFFPVLRRILLQRETPGAEFGEERAHDRRQPRARSMKAEFELSLGAGVC